LAGLCPLPQLPFHLKGVNVNATNNARPVAAAVELECSDRGSFDTAEQSGFLKGLACRHLVRGKAANGISLGMIQRPLPRDVTR
jgi:hypothetical protein